MINLFSRKYSVHQANQPILFRQVLIWQYFYLKHKSNQQKKNLLTDRREYYKKNNPDWSKEQINKKAEEVNFPERVYREKMTDQEGLLVIYILDSYYVFLQEKGKEDSKLKTIVESEGIDLNIPLIGYAIGFPPIEPDPGGVYVHGNYGFDDEEEIEFNEADSELPDDAHEI